MPGQKHDLGSSIWDIPDGREENVREKLVGAVKAGSDEGLDSRGADREKRPIIEILWMKKWQELDMAWMFQRGHSQRG